MKVKELIALLEKLPGDLDVLSHATNHTASAGSVEMFSPHAVVIGDGASFKLGDNARKRLQIYNNSKGEPVFTLGYGIREKEKPLSELPGDIIAVMQPEPLVLCPACEGHGGRGFMPNSCRICNGDHSIPESLAKRVKPRVMSVSETVWEIEPIDER